MIKLKRAREAAARSDGYRVLVERLWPRGVRKQSLAMDEWAKDVAPSTALRQWFHHEPARWREFERRYRQELRRRPAAQELRRLVDKATDGNVTLVFSSKDGEHNNAVVLKAELERRTRGRPSSKRRPQRRIATRSS